VAKRQSEEDRNPATGRTTRTEVLPVRLTPEERRIMSEAAAESGLGLGPWLRSLGMRAAKGRKV
jgi:uncharacterized protein (DUF1778 family)